MNKIFFALSVLLAPYLIKSMNTEQAEAARVIAVRETLIKLEEVAKKGDVPTSDALCHLHKAFANEQYQIRDDKSMLILKTHKLIKTRETQFYNYDSTDNKSRNYTYGIIRKSIRRAMELKQKSDSEPLSKVVQMPPYPKSTQTKSEKLETCVDKPAVARTNQRQDLYDMDSNPYYKLDQKNSRKRKPDNQ